MDSKILYFKRLSPKAVLPTYQSSGASGFDFCSTEKVILKAGQVCLVSTGLSVQIPDGYELQIRARSGLAAKKGVFLVNGIGTIDSDYRGEIKIIMSTCLEAPVELMEGERVAQGVLVAVEKAEIQSRDDLTQTARGAGGFGSTGTFS
jgi:dUTP pyrophosphatase